MVSARGYALMLLAIVVVGLSLLLRAIAAKDGGWLGVWQWRVMDVRSGGAAVTAAHCRPQPCGGVAAMVMVIERDRQ